MTDNQINEIYKLDVICMEQVHLDNILSWIKLRDHMAMVYNSESIAKSLQPMWLQNILIVSSSIIEGLLQSTMIRMEYICNRCNCGSINTCKVFNEIIRENSYRDLISQVHAMGLLDNISEIELHDMRRLRNAIHICKEKVSTSDNLIYADSVKINRIVSLTERVANSLARNLSKLGIGCICTSNKIRS